VSKQQSAPGRVSSRFARPVGWVRDLPIWTKLGLIMIVPTLATIVVGTAGLLDQVQQASNAERARSLAVLSGDAGNLVHRLQDERAIAIQLLNAPGADIERLKDDFTKQQERTEAANVRYRLSRSTLADVPDNLRALLDQIEKQLGELSVMRSQIEGRSKVPLSIAERRYRVLISDLLDIRDLSAQLTGDTTLTDRMRAAAAVATAKEFLSQERAVILQALAYGEMSQAVRRDYVATLKGQELALMAFSAVATQDQQELLDRTVTGPELRETLFFEGELDSLSSGQNPADVVTADTWDQAMVGRANLMNTVEVALNEQAQRAATELGARVQRRVLIETGLLLLTLLLGVLFAWLVARSMARSLRDLRQGALAVAQYGLPQAVARLRDPALSSHMSPAGVALQIAEPLPVRSRDEFGQVTEAFNAVHLEAVRYAREGYSIVLIGHEDHDEVIGTLGEAPDRIFVIADVDEVETLEVPNPDKIAYLTQTTLSVDDTRDVIEALRRKFPKIVGPSRNDICYATQNRQAAVKRLANDVDVLLVIGSANSSNAIRLVEVAQTAGTRAYLINDVGDIQPNWLESARRVGITAGASTPEVLVTQTMEALRGQGVTVREVHVVEEDVRFAIPQELARTLAVPVLEQGEAEVVQRGGTLPIRERPFQRLFAAGDGLVEQSRLSQEVVGVDVPAHLEFSPREVEGLVQLGVVVRVEVSELSVVDHLVERAQPPDVLDQVILLLGVLGATQLYEHVPEGGRVVGERDHAQGLLVEVDGLLVPLLRSPHLGQAGGRAIVVRECLERLEELRIGVREPAQGEVVAAELPLDPGNALPRGTSPEALLDGAAKVFDRELKEDRSAILPDLSKAVNVFVVATRRDRLVEDGRVRRETRHRVIVDVGLQLP